MNTKTAIPLVLAAVLAGCATQPPPRPVPRLDAQQPPRVYVYPQQGQSPEQTDRDRYECHVWATRESGFDPSRHALAAPVRRTVVPAQSANQTVAAGAATGAVLGAVVADRGDAAKGAIIGAVAGSVLGAAAASAQETEAARIEQQLDRRGDRRYEREGAGYRRALSACLEGRGYSVK
ncbi:MAG: hypothetical protein QM696_08935 [Steroidobacteraceae bacterium]